MWPVTGFHHVRDSGMTLRCQCTCSARNSAGKSLGRASEFPTPSSLNVRRPWRFTETCVGVCLRIGLGKASQPCSRLAYTSKFSRVYIGAAASSRRHAPYRQPDQLLQSAMRFRNSFSVFFQTFAPPSESDGSVFRGWCFVSRAKERPCVMSTLSRGIFIAFDHLAHVNYRFIRSAA